MQPTVSSRAPVRVGALVLAVALSLGAGCGGASAGKIPVDSPLVKFEPPDEDEFGEPASDDTAGSDDNGKE